MDLTIRPYRGPDRLAVIDLWRRCDLTRPWNDPEKDIERMLAVYPDLFLVGLVGDSIVATVMGGYDGHRGWIYYLGVLPDYRRRSFGRRMMDEVTRRLEAIGCVKINLQVRGDNRPALGFYEKIGYAPEDRVSLARRLAKD